MTKIISIINQKGGVGKTATAYNLAYALSQTGSKTLLVDIDPSANASRGAISHYDDLDVLTITDLLLDRKADPFTAIIPSVIHGVEIQNLSVLPSDIKLARVARSMMNVPYKETLLHNHLEKIKNYFDYILIDCLPTLTDLNINAIYTADFFIIPVAYTKDALDGMADLFDIISEIKLEEGFDYKILRNSFDGRTKVINAIVEKMLNPFVNKNAVFKTIIKKNEDINKAKANNEPIFTYSPTSSSCEDYKNLVKEIING